MGNMKWIDPTMMDWPEDDYRVHVGNLGNEIRDEDLSKKFNIYSSFLRARAVRDAKTGKAKGYGFVSFGNSDDFIRALKEMNG